VSKKIITLPVNPKTVDIIKNKKIESKFKPSIATLTRILTNVSENGPSAKTNLSLRTNLNYTRLAKHIVWLEKKGFVESIIHKSKINIELTTKGRLFAEAISNE